MQRFFTDKLLCKWYEESYKRFVFEAFQSTIYDKIKQDRRGWEKALGKGIGLWWCSVGKPTNAYRIFQMNKIYQFYI